MSLLVSVVIPAYNEEKRIQKTIDLTASYLASQNWLHEIIVVDDGSADQTAKIVLQAAEQHQSLRLLSGKINQGKGAAVKQGVMVAGGDNILFYDADGSTPIEELGRSLSQDFQVLIGSRRLKESKIISPQPLVREMAGKALSLLVRVIFPELRDIIDTQCGFKLFKRKIAQDLFSTAKINGFLFDIELLLLARRRGYKILQLPVTWKNSPESKVRMLRHLSQIARDLYTMRRG